MTKLQQIYKCSVCGNMVEVVHASSGTLVCCGKNMILQEAKTEDVGQEKHVPVVEKTESGLKIKVGDVPHPMEKEHYIEWIEVITDKKVLRKHLTPTDKATASFRLKCQGKITVREYCNIHGLWETSLSI